MLFIKNLSLQHTLNCKSVHSATSQLHTMLSKTMKKHILSACLKFQFTHGHVLLNNLRSNERALVLVVLNHLL